MLSSLGPLAVMWHVAFQAYLPAMFFNATMFVFATIVSQSVIYRFHPRLIDCHLRHGLMLRVRLFVYAFVAIDMFWTMRLFIGSPGVTVRFFCEEAWSNADVVVSRLIRLALGG